MRDFGALPPEITSTRLSGGPGPGPLLAAASAWDALAHTLESTAISYASVITRLQCESWSGSAADAMASSAAPYLTWVSGTGANALEAARRMRAAAAAFEVALAAIVPPEAVAANRELLAQLAASNIFGQNAPAIAATEAAYEQMWAQDAAAMFDYASSSAAACTLAPFGEPPPNTSLFGQSDQRAAVARAVRNSPPGAAQRTLAQLIAEIPHGLQRLATVDAGNAARPSAYWVESLLLNAFADFNTLTAPINLVSSVIRTYTSGGSFLFAAKRDIDAHASPAETGSAPTLSEPAFKVPEWGSTGLGDRVVAGMGRAAPIGGLSAPQSWASTAPIASLSEDTQWLSEPDFADASDDAAGPTSGLFSGVPAAGIGAATGPWRPTVNNVLRVGPRRFKMPRPSLGG
ncbi:PPE family protein [Mycobacterium simiae]|uniref:PPE family protein n=1 Tax=Mycobacterium simiae TaxID=1784 RepID=A0A1X0XS93_MYCSI|nr:PPE family protein [Mycobacterium simiae]ORJ55782.1 hypothetical protein B5M45_24835 [Mycobacterium simiae]